LRDALDLERATKLIGFVEMIAESLAMTGRLIDDLQARLAVLEAAEKRRADREAQAMLALGYGPDSEGENR
jgi:hypothetical protein